MASGATVNDDLHYYRERVQQLEADLAQANKMIAKLEKRLRDVRIAVLSRNVQSRDDTLSTIAWIAYDWKD